MLKQNELLMQANLSQLKAEKGTTSKLIAALVPVTQKFSKELGHPSPPKNIDEIIKVLEYVNRSNKFDLNTKIMQDENKLFK